MLKYFKFDLTTNLDLFKNTIILYIQVLFTALFLVFNYGILKVNKFLIKNANLKVINLTKSPYYMTYLCQVYYIYKDFGRVAILDSVD